MDAEIVYPGYKEPMVTVSDGFGYMGAVGTTPDGEKLECHICGKHFARLSSHIGAAHSINAQEYREKFSLGATTPLIAEEPRKRYMARYQANFTEERKDQVRRLSIEYRNSGAKKGSNPYHLVRRNKLGKCPDQVLEKIKELAVELGHPPSYMEFTAKHGFEFQGPFRTLHGGYSAAVRACGMVTANDAKTFDRMQMLVAINEFRDKYGRDPLWSDFKSHPMFPDTTVYWRVFGGIKEARKLADSLKIAHV
jgi:hypothetical protein